MRISTFALRISTFEPELTQFHMSITRISYVDHTNFICRSREWNQNLRRILRQSREFHTSIARMKSKFCGESYVNHANSIRQSRAWNQNFYVLRQSREFHTSITRMKSKFLRQHMQRIPRQSREFQRQSREWNQNFYINICGESYVNHTFYVNICGESYVNHAKPNFIRQSHGKIKACENKIKKKKTLNTRTRNFVIDIENAGRKIILEIQIRHAVETRNPMLDNNAIETQC